MAKTETMTAQSQTLGDDPAVRAAVQARAAAERKIEQIDQQLKAVMPEVGSASTSLRRLQLEADRETAEAALAAARKHEEVAKHAACERIIASQRAGRAGLLTRLLVAAEAARDAALALQEHDAATAAACGFAPGAAPVPMLLMLGAPIERLRRLIDPPKSPRPESPPAGKVRVRIVERVRDQEHFGRILYPGDVADFSDDVAADLFRQKVAIEMK